MEEDGDTRNDVDVNNQDLNIDRMEQYLLSGTCGPIEENRNESFSYTASNAIKKTQWRWLTVIVHRLFLPLRFCLTILWAISLTNWKGVLNICVTIPAFSVIHYPIQFSRTKEVTIVVDIIKCTNSIFRKRNICFFIKVF